MANSRIGMLSACPATMTASDARESSFDARDGDRAECATGWLVDIACLRRYAPGDVARRAAIHTTACARMGHCVESGYGVVDRGGRLRLLDTHATPMIVQLLRTTEQEQGLWIEADRQSDDGDLETVAVWELVRRHSA